MAVCLEMAFKIHKQWSVCRGGYNESSRPRRRKNKKQVAVRRAVDSILETLRNSKSIQIKRLFRTERSVSLTLNFKHVFLLEEFNGIISNIAIIESSTDRRSDLQNTEMQTFFTFVFSSSASQKTLKTVFRPISIL